MQALGFIETRGLLTAIESADAMLKSAEVSLLEKTYVGGGLVSVAVTGDVAAVSAAVEAGAAAVKQLNESSLVSKHVIPRPHEELTGLFGGDKPPENVEKQRSNIVFSDEEESATDYSDESKNASNAKEVKLMEESTARDENPIRETTVKDELVEETGDRLNQLDENEITKNTIDNMVLEHGLQETLYFLSKLKVTKLRKLARDYRDLTITGRFISKAAKKTLLTEFEKYYNK